MGQTKKKTKANWQSRRESSRGLIVVLVVVGLIVAAAAYLLQSSGVFALNAGQAAKGKGVLLSEVAARNAQALVTDDGDMPDWVEISNTGDETVDLAHYGLALESNIHKMFIFPACTLAPGEHLVVYCLGSAASESSYAYSAPFRINAAGGDTLILMNVGGKAVDAIQLPELSDGQAYARQDDGSWSLGAPTPAQDNAAAPSGGSGVTLTEDQLEISEVSSDNVLFFADENGECHDYIEIHNTGSEAVNLQGWYLSDSAEKLKRWAFPEVVLPAGGYLAVHCSAYDRSANAAHLHTDFRLSSAGETVYLSRPDGRCVSTVAVPALLSSQAYSLVDGAWSTELAPTPGAANTVDGAAQVSAATFGDRDYALRINEIMASATEQAYDWVELYNGSGEVIDLSGYGLSDRPDKPRKWQFPQGTTIQPGQYLGIFMSGLQEGTLSGFLNADFKLSSVGGYMLCLSDPDGRVLDAIYVGQQYGGISYGRVQGRSGCYHLETATPGADNTGACYSARTPQPTPSVYGGLYESGDSFTVTLSAPEGCSVYYTLDSTDPSPSAALYTGPIQISGTTILRTRAYHDGWMPSLIDTQSYLYDVSNASGVFVVSLVADPANLIGESGIMSNYKMDWEREGHVEIFKADGENIISQGCGLSLHGMDSRKLPIKSFNVIARSQYGESRLNYPIFSERDYESYQSILLRPSGEDYNMSFMRDTVLSSLMKDSSLMYQKYEVAICYLNGEYYTLYYIRERINKHSICQFEGWEGMENELDIVRGNEQVQQGSNADFAALLDWTKNNDTSTDAAYEYLDSKIDIQNYIEYMSIEIFTGNTDTLNVRRYRNPKADGKWHWALYDLDWAFFNDTNSIKNWLTPGGTGAGKRTDNKLFIACMKNPTFREQFLVYFGQQMATNFCTENVISKIRERCELLQGVLPQFLERWNLSLNAGVKKIRNYAEERPNKLLNTYFRECFGFSDVQMEYYFGDALEKIEEYASEKAGG